MRRVRMVVAVVVAVAMMSFGAAACTPADQANAEQGVTGVIGLVLYAIFAQIELAACPGGCFPY